MKTSMDCTEAAVRFRETSIVSWVCDLVAEDYNTCTSLQLKNKDKVPLKNCEADIAMLQAYCIAGKKEFDKGEFTLGHAFEMFPKEMTVNVSKLTGRQIIEQLQRGVKSLPEEAGALVHVSERLSYEVELYTKPKINVVTNVKFNDKPIVLDDEYTVAYGDSMGGMYSPQLELGELIVDEESGSRLIQDLIINHCIKKGGVKKAILREDPNAVNNETGRIKMIDIGQEDTETSNRTAGSKRLAGMKDHDEIIKTLAKSDKVSKDKHQKWNDIKTILSRDYTTVTSIKRRENNTNTEIWEDIKHINSQ